MIDSVLMRWAVKRYARFYWFVLLFLLAGLAAALILMAPQAVIQAEKHPFFLFGIVMSLAWGAGIFTREYRQGNLLEFLIALPVSRDRFFNTMLLAGAAPLLLLMFIPFVYVIILSPWFNFSLSAVTLFLACLLAAGWAAAVFMLGTLWGLFLVSFRGRFGRAASVAIVAVLVAVFVNLSNLDGPFNPVWQAQNYPVLSLAVAVSASALIYYAGRNKIVRMDI